MSPGAALRGGWEAMWSSSGVLWPSPSSPVRSTCTNIGPLAHASSVPSGSVTAQASSGSSAFEVSPMLESEAAVHALPPASRISTRTPHVAYELAEGRARPSGADSVAVAQMRRPSAPSTR